MLNNNFGYACKNIHLSNPKDFGDKYLDLSKVTGA